MPDFPANVRRLSAAAWRLRAAAPRARRACPPFALVLMTDERRQPDLLKLVRALPSARADFPAMAVIFRHYSLSDGDRTTLADEVRNIVQSKGHVFLMAGGHLPGADGFHGRNARAPASVPVHSLREASDSATKRAAFGLLSPVFATRSHPEVVPLGPARAAAIARRSAVPLFALGGINTDNSRRLIGLPLYGIAAIGAFTD